MSRLGDILEILARYRPDYGVCRIAELGEGTDHRAYEINGELVLRFSTDPDPAGRAALTRRLGSLLTKVATLSPLPTPVPDLVLPAEGCLAYRRLPGEPLSGLPVAERRRLGLAATRTLGAFLTAVHGLPMHLIADLVDRDDLALHGWQREAERSYSAAAGELPVESRHATEGFLSGPVPEESHIAVFCHNDLGAEHLLVEPDTSTLTAVIDWSDAAVTDPAHDFGLLLRDLGPRVFSGVLHHYNRDVGDPAALRARAVFYARCKLLEDLAYGLDTGRQEYIDNALGSLPCLFGANSSSR